MVRTNTYTIMVGSPACVYKCPICIAKLTPKPPTINVDVKWDTFDKATAIARDSGATTVLLTGKGEPLLFPEQVSLYLAHLSHFGFSNIEIQTAGVPLTDESLYRWEDRFKLWNYMGLNTVALSLYHYNESINREMYGERVDGKGFDMFKVKPPTLESYYRRNRSPSTEDIKHAVHNVFGRADEITEANVLEELSEDFNERAIDGVKQGIERVIQEVIEALEFRRQVLDTYDTICVQDCGLTDKHDIMVVMSQCFQKIQMNKVYAILHNERGI